MAIENESNYMILFSNFLDLLQQNQGQNIEKFSRSQQLKKDSLKSQGSVSCFRNRRIRCYAYAKKVIKKERR